MADLTPIAHRMPTVAGGLVATIPRQVQRTLSALLAFPAVCGFAKHRRCNATGKNHPIHAHICEKQRR